MRKNAFSEVFRNPLGFGSALTRRARESARIAASQNEADVTPTDHLNADRFLAPLEFATFAWDLATDATVWGEAAAGLLQGLPADALQRDRKSTRLNSSHVEIS